MDYYETRERLTALAQKHGSALPVCIELMQPTEDGQNLEATYHEVTDIDTTITPIGKRIIVLRT